MSAVRAEDLTARYTGQAVARAALNEVSLVVHSGERLLLLGPNGAGKSTFIRVFAGLMRPTRGQAWVADAPARLARASVGVVSHATYLYDELTALENVRFYASLYGVADAPDRARELLEQVGMGHLRDALVGRMSRGQQQRVTIARALVHDPPVLLLDEPDTGLDVAAFDMLADLITPSTRTVVVTTHNLAAGLRLATRVAVLARGRVVHEAARVAPSDAAGLGTLLEEFAR